MWDRKELKAKGKEAYRRNRVICIIAALLLAVASGAGGASTAGSTASNNIQKNINKSKNDTTINYDVDDINDLDELEDRIENMTEDELGYSDAAVTASGVYVTTDTNNDDFGYKNDEGTPSGNPLAGAFIAGLVGILIIILIIVLSCLSIFVLNPLKVGLRKFFTDNATDPNAGLSKNNIGLAFSDKYMSVVGAMFTTKLFIGLWALLFIIPGIYKALQWRMVEFIISENPGISGKEARKQSKEMMQGSKWASFVLDLSFLGWNLLGGLTLGILNVVFTNPYEAATESELWLHLSGRPTPPLAVKAAPAAQAAPAAPAAEPAAEAVPSAPAAEAEMAPETPATEPEKPAKMRSVVRPSRQAPRGSPAFRQTASRNSSGPIRNSSATPGRRSPRLPPALICKPCRPISKALARSSGGTRTSSIPQRTQTSIERDSNSEAASGGNRGSSRAAETAED